ncbi:response regulator [Flavobacterium sp. NG2]|uniref:hybrid sensor histidine kinase/response regulator n=1 Tax=Flavobacterium sp. NG2 TaxID=3097547 RepID=UPI002A82561C|nr:response regulator [Flavobacterium sp. NG2]WPR72946.1 response regulator [Flavobacterium sp. NG2]
MKFSLPNLRDFRIQIFLSFSLIIILIAIWFLFYLTIDRKIDHLNDFSYKSYRVSQDISTNTKRFQTFLLYGYKEKYFYINHSQKDLDQYISNLKKQRTAVDAIFKESKELDIEINHKLMSALSNRIDTLITVINQYKKIALIRGFKDYGIEGKMRNRAHFLEEKELLPRATILQFRRHEKDYLLRSEKAYIQKFSNLYDNTIISDEIDSTTRQALLEYKRYFDNLVTLSSQLGETEKQGLNGKINKTNEAIEDLLTQIINHNENRINNLKENLFYFQIGQTLLMIFIALFLCIYLSKYFTKDIKELSMDISNFILSDFKNKVPSVIHKSSIKEVDYLLNSYTILKEKLSKNVHSLEKNTEIATNTAKFKTQFLANMSHEIRSPLNGVMGMLNILKTSPLNAEQSEYIEIAEHSADHLLGIVNMILDHSKMEAGKMKLEEYPIHLEKELSKLIRLFDYRIKDKNICLNFNYDSNITNTILCDNLRLQQILINLLDNAIKFTHEGDVKLEVSLLKQNENIQHLNFKVMDSGIGIDVEKTEQLLLAFEQADLSTTRKYGGTGLGLTISNQLISLMGGSKLNIIALEEGGSSFSFDIPFKLDLSAIPIENNKSNTTIDLRVHKALIVEDNLINQKVLRKLLDKLDIPSDIANNGKEAVSLFEQNEYNMIFMDLHMPEMDGFEATKTIHAHTKYKSKNIPIIAVTASAFDEDKTKAIASGMDDFITKPIVLKHLEETICKQMRLREV